MNRTSVGDAAASWNAYQLRTAHALLFVEGSSLKEAATHPKCAARLRHCQFTTLTLRHYQVLVDCPNADQRARYEALAIQDSLDSRALHQRIVQDQRARAGVTTLLPRPTDPGYLYRAKVEQVIDGDTFDLRIDVGFEMSRNGRFRLASVDCPELPTPEGRRARDFVYKRLLRAKTIVVKTQRTDLHGRYVTHLFYSPDEVDIPTCFTQSTHLNEELLRESHAVLAV